MALLGSTVDPRLFVQDYSGFTRAADIQGQSIANLGRQIAGGIERYGEIKQERKKLEAGTKAAVTGIESAIKMGESLGIDVKSSLTPYLDKINDPNVSPIEAAAYAQQASNSIANVLNLGMKVNEMGVEKARYAQTAAARIAELQAEANKPTKLKSEKAIVGGLEVPTLMDDFGNYYDPSTKRKIIDLPGYARGLPAERVLEQVGGFVAPAMPMGSTQAVDTGMVLPELQKNVLTLSKDAQATIDAATAGYIDGMPTVGLPIAQGQSQSVQAGLDVIPPAAPDDSKLTPRGTSIEKEKKAETQMTAAQVQGLAAQGFRVNARPLADGSFMVSGTDIGGQAGETIETTPEGGFRIVRGGGGGGKTQAATEEAKKQSFERSRSIIGSASKIIPEIKSILSSNPLIAAGQKTLGDVLPATEVGRISTDLETIRTITSKEEVNNARAASPTGSAGGSITEKEWPKFENRFGKMAVGMNPSDLVSNVQKTALNQFESVNGTPEDVIKLFNNGKISKPVFDEYIKEYKKTRSILGVSDAGTGGPGDDWTKYNPNLLRFDKEKQSQLSPEAQELQDKINALKLNQ